VTGSNTGIGKEVAHILYSKNAKVYVAARSEEKAGRAIEAIKKAFPNSEGELVFLRLDLADLTTIKASAEEFLSKETKLHVLFNNAGIWAQLKGSPKTVQGHALEIGVNNIGPFMFTKLLTPLLIATARTEPSDTVRVVWVSSVGAELDSPSLVVCLLTTSTSMMTRGAFSNTMSARQGTTCKQLNLKSGTK